MKTIGKKALEIEVFRLIDKIWIGKSTPTGRENSWKMIGKLAGFECLCSIRKVFETDSTIEYDLIDDKNKIFTIRLEKKYLKDESSKS